LIMGLFLREKRDGRRAAGYLLYLLGGLGIFAVFALIEHRVGGAGQNLARAPGAPRPGASPSPPTVAEFPGEANGGHRGSGAGRRVPSEQPDSPQGGSFDAIAAALERPAAEGIPAQPGSPSFAALPPALPPEGASPRQGPRRGETAAHPSAPAEAAPTPLLGYRDASADGRTASGPGVPGTHSRRPEEHRVPTGTLISVYLLTDVDTGNGSEAVEFGAARALYFNHREQIPFGTRFLGRFSGQVVRDRVSLTADTVLYPDGLELPVSASAVEANDDGTGIYPGIAAYFFPPPAWAQIAPYVSEAVTGYLGLLASRSQPPITITAGSLGIQSAGAADPRTPLYQASAQAIGDFTGNRLKEIEQRYAGHYLVPAGTALWLELTSDLELGAAESGSDPSPPPPQPTGPGVPEPRPSPPNP